MAENIAIAVSVLGKGMLGIFIVTAVIIGAITLLSLLPEKKSD